MKILWPISPMKLPVVIITFFNFALIQLLAQSAIATPMSQDWQAEAFNLAIEKGLPIAQYAHAQKFQSYNLD